jgi:DNA invertase Pin-like site-specific DNA recombinase
MLAKAPAALKPGDTLVVWKLDRLARSLSHLLALFEDFEARGVGFRSLTEAIDTTNPAGRLISQIHGCLGRAERALRTKAGFAVARANGRTRGAGQRSRLRLPSSSARAWPMPAASMTSPPNSGCTERRCTDTPKGE